MAVSRIDLANMALGLLLRDSIRDPDGSEPGAVQTKLNVELAIGAVIAEYDWFPCRIVKSLQVVNSVNLRGWTYAYQIPSDAIMIWKVSDLKGEQVTKFEIGMTDDITSDDNFIYSDATGLAIRYGSSRVNLSRFPPQIIDLMAKSLAIRCCMSLTKDKALYQLHQKDYKTELSAAKTLYANLEPEIQDVEFIPEAILVRSS